MKASSSSNEVRVACVAYTKIDGGPMRGSKISTLTNLGVFMGYLEPANAGSASFFEFGVILALFGAFHTVPMLQFPSQ